jgi:prepilin peptidase CpaA
LFPSSFRCAGKPVLMERFPPRSRMRFRGLEFPSGGEAQVAQLFTVPVVVVFAAVLASAVTDVWRFRVHNALTLPLLASGLIYQSVAPEAPGLVNGLLGALFGFSALVVFWMMGGIGAGDVKLLAGVGAWLGMPLTFYVFIASSLAVGVYSMVLLVANRRLQETWVNLQIAWHRLKAVGRYLGSEADVEAAMTQAERRQRLVPFAAMVAVGIVVALLAASWLAKPS